MCYTKNLKKTLELHAQTKRKSDNDWFICDKWLFLDLLCNEAIPFSFQTAWRVSIVKICILLFWICWLPYWSFPIKLVNTISNKPVGVTNGFLGSFSSLCLNEEHSTKFQHQLWYINSRRTNISCERNRVHMFHICSTTWLNPANQKKMFIVSAAKLDKYVLWYDCKTTYSELYLWVYNR